MLYLLSSLRRGNTNLYSMHEMQSMKFWWRTGFRMLPLRNTFFYIDMILNCFQGEVTDAIMNINHLRYRDFSSSMISIMNINNYKLSIQPLWQTCCQQQNTGIAFPYCCRESSNRMSRAQTLLCKYIHLPFPWNPSSSSLNVCMYWIFCWTDAWMYDYTQGASLYWIS